MSNVQGILAVLRNLMSAARQTALTALSVSPVETIPAQNPDQAIAGWLGISPEQAARLTGWPTSHTRACIPTR